MILKKLIINLIKRYIFPLGIFSFFNFLIPILKKKKVILCYHRIVENEYKFTNYSPNNNLAVTKYNFEQQILKLKSHYTFVSMNEYLETNTLHNKSNLMTITFDDGYKDNLINALPILVKHNIPATIFYCTKFLNKDGWLWWYELWTFIENKSYCEFTFADKKFNYKINTIASKNACFFSVGELIKNMSYLNQKSFFNDILKIKNLTDYSNLMLNYEDLILLSNSKLIEIGSHGINHQNMNILNDNELISEIKNSKSILEKILNKQVLHFAYPYGGFNDFNDKSSFLIKKFGYKSAVTTLRGSHNYNNFKLSRYGVDNFYSAKSLLGMLLIFHKLI